MSDATIKSNETPSKQGQTYRVLLVDDDSDMLTMLHRRLSSHFKTSAKFTLASNVNDALDDLSHQRFDMIISDLDMDDLNGLHLLKRVKEQAPLIQVIILTGHQSANAIRSSMRLGADEFLTKPIDNEVLGEAVDYLIKRQARLRATCSSD